MTAGAPSSESSGHRVLLEMRGIHKRFPGVHALKGINIDVRPGEVHALVGENGAGKSTLMHILAGVYQPDAGSIHLDGEANVILESEHDAQSHGVAIVFQERSLFEQLSIAENIFAARQPVNRWGKIERKALLSASAQLLNDVKLGFDPRTPVSQLSPAQQQMVEIAKALSLKAKLIIFDEPTAALTESETTALFHVIAQLKRSGVGIIYISHRLEEIFQIADRVTVLKDGSLQGTFAVSQTTTEDLVSRMVGRELALHERHLSQRVPATPVMFAVRELTDAPEFRGSRPFLSQISFDVRAGDIVVFAGLAGAGRTELALSLFGARPRSSGEIRVAGVPVAIRSPQQAIAAGLGYAHEDRKEAGLFLEMSISQNIAAACLRRFGPWWFNDRAGDRLADEYRQRLRIATPSVGQTVRNLSGGNQQKVVLSKWLSLAPKVLIVDEPTRGIDVGAKAEVHQLLRQVAQSGTAVIVISSDLPEVLAVADRVIVMREGRIAGELSGPETSEEAIMTLASTATPH